jgi:hypothetical protein
MSVANLNAFALEKGMNKAFDKMSQAEQATLRYQYLLEATKDAQGDFARTGDSFSNEMRKLQTNLDRIKTEFGKGLLGVVTPAISLLNNVLSDKSYQYKDAEKIYTERNQALFDAQATYAESMTIVNAMRNMEDESGEAIKSTDAWRLAIEELINVMPGLAQYVDLTSDAIIGNTESINQYVDAVNGVSQYAAHENAVNDAAALVDADKQELAKLNAYNQYLQSIIDSAESGTIKAERKAALERAYEYFKSTVPNLAFADTWEEFTKSSPGNPSQYTQQQNVQKGLKREYGYYQLTGTAADAWNQLMEAEEAYNNPSAYYIAQQQENQKQIEATTQKLQEDTKAYNDATAAQNDFVESNEKAKKQYDFDKAVEDEKKALEDLKTALKDVETYRADTLKKAQEAYKGVASGMGYMVTHTQEEMKKLLDTDYSKENVLSWYGTNADALHAYNDALKQAETAGVDVGILSGLTTYSRDNDAYLSRLLNLTPEEIKQLNADYQRARDEENAMAETKTRYTLADDETYQAMLETVQKSLEAFEQKDEIAAYMAENNNSLLAGIDKMRKTLEAEIPGINALLEQLGFKQIDYKIKDKPWVHDHGGARAGYADLFADVAKDKNAFNKDEAKALHAIKARARSGYADMIEDGLMPDDIKARAQRWNRLVEMKTQEMNDIVDILEQRMEGNQRQREAEEAEQWNNRATKDMPPLYMMDTIIANAAHPKFVPNTYIGAPSSEQQEKTTGGNFFSAIESAIDAAKEIESRTIQEDFVTQSIFNALGEMMENYKESLKNNSAPNIFSNGDGVLFVQVTNPDEIANAVSGLPPTTINNTFSVDGKTVATEVAPIVNKIIGRGIRGNLMEVAR